MAHRLNEDVAGRLEETAGCCAIREPIRIA